MRQHTAYPPKAPQREPEFRHLVEILTAPRLPFLVAQPQAATERIVRSLLLGDAVASNGVRLEHDVPTHVGRNTMMWMIFVNGCQAHQIHRSTVAARYAVQITSIAGLLLTLGFDPAATTRSTANVYNWTIQSQKKGA